MRLFLSILFIKGPQEFVPYNTDTPEGYALCDLDNFSDDMVVSTALRAIQESDVIHLRVRAKHGAKLGGILKIFNALVKFKGDLKVSFEGSNERIESMLKRLPHHERISNSSLSK